MDQDKNVKMRKAEFARELIDRINSIPQVDKEDGSANCLIDRSTVLENISEWATGYWEPVHYWRFEMAGAFPIWRCSGCGTVMYLEPPRDARFCPGCGVMMNPEVDLWGERTKELS